MASASVCGVLNPADGKYYRHYESMCNDAQCPVTRYGTILDYDAATCAVTDSSIVPPGICTCGPDGDTMDVVYSNQDTFSDVLARLAAAQGGCSVDGLVWGDAATGSATDPCSVESGACSLVAFYYTDGTTYAQKCWLSFIAPALKYCLTFTSQDGATTTSTTMTSTVGQIVTVDPPTTAGYITVTFRPCSP